MDMETMRNSPTPLWKTDPSKYAIFHYRVRMAKGTPSKCEVCEDENNVYGYDWANLTGHYDDVNDYQRMCKSCHSKYDKKALNILEKFSYPRTHCYQGHELTQENIVIEGTKRRCKICRRANHARRNDTKRDLRRLKGEWRP